MKTQKIDAIHTNFRSKFVPNKTLSNAFDIAMIEQDGKFLSAVEKILNDGKSDTIELSPQYTPKKAYQKLALKVNGIARNKIAYDIPIVSIDGAEIVSGFDAQDLIIQHSKIQDKDVKQILPSKIVEQLSNLMEKIFKDA